jgi:hypothetical protein
MKKIGLIIILCFFSIANNGQSCLDSFVDNVPMYKELSIKKNAKSIKKIIQRYNKENANSLLNYKLICIPVIISSKVKNQNKKDELLCYLDDNFEFGQAIVIVDSCVYGYIIQCPKANCKLTFMDKNSFYYKFMEPVFLEISKINPDLIFEIHNLSNAIWFLKSGELKVMTYKNENGKVRDFEIISVNDYINKLDYTDFLIFTNSKRKKIIAY